MNGNNNQNSLIVNPLKTEKMVGSANVAIPNTVEHFGTHTQIAEDVQKIGMNWQRIRDFQDKTLGMNFLASIRDELSKFQVDLASKKETYQSDERINALKQKYQEKVEMYKKIASEQGYDSDYVDAYIARANQELQGAENNFLVKNLKYQEEVAIDNYNQGFLIQEQTNERYMVSGNYAQGISGFLETVGYLNDGVKSGYIDRAKVPIMIKQGWNGMLKAHVESLINIPNGASQIEQMLNWNFNQFASYFSKLDTKVGDNEFKLGSDEFEVWKSGLRSAYASLKSRQKAEKEMTKVEEIKKEYWQRNNPVESAYNDLGLKQGDNIPLQAVLIATERKNQKNFNSLDEAIEQGYSPAYLPKDVIKYNEEFENDPNVSITSKLQNKLDNFFTYAGTRDKKIMQNFFDTTNNGIIPASSLTIDVLLGTVDENENVSRAGKILNNEIQELYNTPEKITMYKTFEKTKVNEALFKDYDKKLVYDTNSGSGYLKNITHEIIAGAGTVMKDLQFNAMHGDLRAKGAYEDIEKITKHFMLEKLLEQTNGILQPEIAKKLKIEEKANMPFETLNDTEKQQVVDFYFEKDEFKEAAKNTYEKVVKDGYGANFKQIDLGNNGRLILDNNYDAEKTRKAVLERINNKDMVFINSRTGQRIANHKNIKALSYIGENKIILKHGSENVVDENGKPYILIPIKMEDKK